MDPKQQELPLAPPQAPPTSDKAPPAGRQPRTKSPPSPSPQDRRAPARALASPPKSVNPYASPAMADRRRAVLDQLREDRGGATPTPKAAPKEPAKEPEAKGADAGNGGDAQPTPAEKEDSRGQTNLQLLQAQYEARERAVKEAEARARQADTASEKRKAEIEALEAKNAAHLKRLEMVANDPIQFFSEAGLKEEDFKRYLSQGGKDTPEAQRMRATEAALREVREELKAFKEENAKARTQAQRDREDSAFLQELAKDDYVVVNNLGGIQVVRAKQAELGQTLGKPVTLAEAAGQLEKEFTEHFKSMLAKDNIRRKLGLSSVESTAGSREASPRTLNGAVASSTAESDPPPAWNDYAGKKRRVMQLLERENEREKARVARH